MLDQASYMLDLAPSTAAKGILYLSEATLSQNLQYQCTFNINAAKYTCREHMAALLPSFVLSPRHQTQSMPWMIATMRFWRP